MNIKNTSVLILSLLICLMSFAQEKSVCKKNISEPIKNYIKTNYPGVEHLKYYEVKDGEQRFIESEFEFKEDEYSLKFLQDSLYEVEVVVKFKEMPEMIQTRIKTTLDSLFSDYKITECQEVNPKTKPLYEISIKGNLKTSEGYFEVFFDRSGAWISTKEEVINSIPSQF